MPGMVASGPVIYLVRHGETLATLERRYEGRGDSDLTAKGLEQARRVANDLSAIDIRAVYTSPRLRAVRTAQVIAAQHGLVPVTLEGLAEVDFGEWDGLTFDEIRRRDPDLVDCWLANPVEFRPPSGESLTDLWTRVRGSMEGITGARIPAPAGPATTGAIVVVSHGGPIRAILSFCDRGDLSGFWSASILPGEVKAIQSETYCPEHRALCR